MPSWKKVVASGSDASFSSATVDTFVSASSFRGSFTGSLFGTASQAISSSYAFTASSATNAFSSSFALTASFVNPLRQNVIISGSLTVSASATALSIQGSGSNVFSVDGTSGRLFEVDDSLSGSLFSVNTAAGLPVIEAFSDNTVRIGQFGQRALFVSQSRVGVGTETPTTNLDVSGSGRYTNGLSLTGSVNSLNGYTGSLFGTASWARNAITASYALGGDASAILYQTASAAFTWSFNHFLQTQYPVFTIYDNTNSVIVPQRIQAVDTSSALIYFSSPTTGIAVASKGGYSSSVVTSAVIANTAITASFALSGTGTFSGSFSGSYQGNFSGSLVGTASQAESASYAFTASSAISSSYALTASFLLGYVSPFPFTGSAQITGSLGVTGSVNITGSIQLVGDITSSGNFLLSGQNGLNLDYSTGLIKFKNGNWLYTNSTDARFYLQSTAQYFRWYAASGTEITRLYSSGNWIIQNGGTFTDNGYRLQINGSGSLSGSLLVSGSSVFQNATTSSDGGVLGPELTTASGWVSGSDWTGVYNSFTHISGSGNTPLTSSLAAVNGNNYAINYTIATRNSGSITLSYGGLVSSGATTSGTAYGKATSTALLYVTPTADFDGTVSLSVKQVTAGSANTTFQNSSGTANIEVRASGASPTNTFIGLNSGRFSIGGTQNTSLGYNALSSILSANNTTAIGYNAGTLITTGGSNTLIGSNAGQSITTGGANTLIGSQAGQLITTGGSNTIIGTSSGISTGGSNVIIGNAAGTGNASFAVIIGVQAGFGLTSGGSNILIGYNSGFSISTGANNIAIGYQAGRYISSGSTSNQTSQNSIYLGYDVRASANGDTNEIVIAGYNGTAGQVGLGSNTTVIGNSSTTVTGIYGNLVLVGSGSANLMTGSTTGSGYTLNIAGPSTSGSLYVNGFTIYNGTISGSQPANNVSSSLILISGSINPTGSAGTGSAVLLNTVMSASANNQTLVGLDINPTFSTGSFTGTTSAALRVGGSIITTANLTYDIGSVFNNFGTVWASTFRGAGNASLLSGGATLVQGQTAIIAGLTNGIQFKAASSTQNAQVFSTGNWLLQQGGTFTDAGYKLDVSGSTRLNGNTQITGSLGVTGSINVSGGITGSLFGTASQAITASYVVTAQTASYVLNAVSSSYAFTASSAINASASLIAVSASQAATASSADTFVVRNDITASNALITETITAQTLVVSTISSSVAYSSGSNIFGNSTANTQTFTGSVNITGSLNLNGKATLTDLTGSLFGTASWAQNASTASYILNAVSSSYAFTASSATNASASLIATSASYAFTASSAISSSFALTASYALNAGGSFPYTGSAQITGSLGVTGSFSVSANAGSSVFSFNADTLLITGSLIITGSGASITGSLNVSSGITGSLFGTASQALTASYALGGDASAILYQTASAAFTWSFNHFLQTQYPVFTIYDSGNNVIIPQRIQAVDTSSALIYFSSPTTGVAVASKGGYSSSVVTSATTANTAITASFALSGTGTFSGSFSGSYQGALSGSLIGTASQAVSASYVLNAVSSSYAFTASSAISSSYALTASFLLGGASGIGFPYSGSAQITGSLGVTGSLYVNGFTVYNGTISGSQPANNPSSSLILVSGSFYASSSRTTAVYIAPYLTATGSGQILEAVNINPSFSGSTTAKVALRISTGNLVIGSNSDGGSRALYVGGIIESNASVFALSMGANSYGSATGVPVSISAPSLYLSGSNISMTGSVNITGSLSTSGSIFVSGSITTTSNLTISATNTTTSSPRVIGFTPLPAGSAVEMRFGDQYTQLRSGNAQRMQLLSYWGMEIYGNRTNIATSYAAGTGADPSLNVYGSVAANPVLVVTAAGSQTANIQEWRNSSNTILAAISNNGTLILSGSANITGSLSISGSLLLNQSTSSLGISTQTVSTNSTSSYTSAFYRYSVVSGSNARAGEFIACWNGSSVQYTDYSTTDIGNTSLVSFTASLSAGNVVLTTVLPSSGWNVNTLVNLL